MPEDETLVSRSQQGDREAFACLYDRFAPLVRSIAFDATGSHAGIGA